MLRRELNRSPSLSWVPPGAGEGKPGLLQAMEAAWHKAAKRGAQAAGRRVKWALALLSASFCLSSQLQGEACMAACGVEVEGIELAPCRQLATPSSPCLTVGRLHGIDMGQT